MSDEGQQVMQIPIGMIPTESLAATVLAMLREMSARKGTSLYDEVDELRDAVIELEGIDS